MAKEEASRFQIWTTTQKYMLSNIIQYSYDLFISLSY